jgi:neutral ceramidase
MGQLLAGAGEISLDPPLGGWMTGFAARVAPSAGTHDPLMARAVLLDDGVQRVAIISCDLLGWAPDAARVMRRSIGEGASLPEGSVLISCTHTHSGPASMPLRGVMGYLDEGWLAAVQARIVGLACGLAARLVPATLAWAATTVKGIGYNRQDQGRPTDETLVVMGIDRAEPAAEGGRRTIATLVNYATHAVVLGPRNLLYSGDFPGAVARRLAARRGGVGLYLQGTCGDVDPTVYRDRGWGTGDFTDTEAIGERLAAAADEALERTSQTAQVQLGAAQETLEVPVDAPPTVRELDAIVSDLKQQEQRGRAEGNVVQEKVALAMLDWADRLRRAIASGDLAPILSFDIFCLRLNELRLIGIPFETYSDIGLVIKRNLAPLQGIVVGYTNGLYGYFPTRWAKDQGGYGADTSCRWFPTLLTPIGYGADDILVAKATALARSL